MSKDHLIADAESQMESSLSLFAEEQIPSALAVCIERHRARVINLVTSLRGIGLSDKAIRESVRTVIESYEEELLVALNTLN